MAHSTLFRAAACATARGATRFSPTEDKLNTAITYGPKRKHRKKIAKQLTDNEKQQLATKQLIESALERLPKDQRPKDGESLAACFLNADLVGCIPFNRVLLDEINANPELSEKYEPLIAQYRERRAVEKELASNY